MGSNAVLSILVAGGGGLRNNRSAGGRSEVKVPKLWLWTAILPCHHMVGWRSSAGPLY